MFETCVFAAWNKWQPVCLMEKISWSTLRSFCNVFFLQRQHYLLAEVLGWFPPFYNTPYFKVYKGSGFNLIVKKNWQTFSPNINSFTFFWFRLHGFRVVYSRMLPITPLAVIKMGGYVLVKLNLFGEKLLPFWLDRSAKGRQHPFFLQFVFISVPNPVLSGLNSFRTEWNAGFFGSSHRTYRSSQFRRRHWSWPLRLIFEFLQQVSGKF